MMPLQSASFARIPWFLGFIFAVVGLVCAVSGWWFLATQHFRLATYLPVEAHVIESRVIASGQDAHQPVISYSYSVQGHRYEGHRVSAIGNYATTGTWAWDIASRFPAGANATAWYSAGDPASSFIVRDVEFIPHFVAIFGFVFFLVGGWVLLQSLEGRRLVTPPARGRDGRFYLRAEVSNGGAFRLFAAAAIAWYAYVALVIGDYWVLNRLRVDAFSVIATAITAGLGLILLVQAWRCWKLQHAFMDAKLSVDGGRFQLGSLVRLRIEQGFVRRLLIDELSMGAVCMRSDRVTNGTSVNYPPASVACRVQKRLAVNRDYSPGSQLSAACEFTLPDHAEPSTPPRSSIFPIYQWYVLVEIAAQGEPTLSLRFPIVVETGSRAAAVRINS